MSEAEKPELNTGKRIVSKQEYAKAVFKKATSHINSFLLIWLSMLVGSFSGVVFALLLIALFVSDKVLQSADLIKELHGWQGYLAFFLALTSGIIARAIFVFGKERDAQSHKMRINVAPLTRANIGDLPAPESLVRASAEQPLQAQQTILLRAAAPGQQTPVEQLVRPSAGQEERQ